MEVRFKVTASSRRWRSLSAIVDAWQRFRAIQADPGCARFRGDGSGEETEQKTKTEKLGIGMPDQCVREDSRVLLERCDRLCVVVEVMSGVYHGLEFPSEVSASCGRNPLRPG